MQLTFESLAELQDFVQWVQAARQVAPIEPAQSTVVVQAIAPSEGVEELRNDEIVATPAAMVEQIADNPAEPRRKRRTKAEMEAARAAESAGGKSDPAAPSESTSDGADTAEESSTAVTATSAPEASAEFDNDPRDAPDFIKSRLVERPEVSQVEHLNLARTFIGKHGMEKYNQSFPLVGLTPNVMGYSPADCATHAAALDFLSLE